MGLQEEKMDARNMTPQRTLVAVLLFAVFEWPVVAQPKPRPIAFRGIHFFIFDVNPGQKVTVVLKRGARGSDYGQISYLAVDSKSRTLVEGQNVEGETPIKFTVPEDAGDVAALMVKGGRNWYVVEKPSAPCIVRADRLIPVHVTGDAAPFYFFVPEGTKGFRVYVICESLREGATVRILRPDGTEAAKMTAQFDKAKPLEVRGVGGKPGVWAIQLEHPRKHGADFSLDDVNLFFSKNLPPFLALDRSALPGLIGRHPE